MALRQRFGQLLYNMKYRFIHISPQGLANQYSTSVETIDPKQLALMEEPCILIDENDNKIGSASKLACHLIENGTSPLHRAVSIYLFNSAGELLIHQRSDKKITYPGYYTNTCCSHPLHTPQEMIEENAWGIRCAAQRRLHFELGIPMAQAMPEEFKYITRIHSASASDGKWGENEIGYIMFLHKDVDLNPNENEIKDVKYVKFEDLSNFLDGLRKNNIPITPWFDRICQKLLPEWWQNLDNLDKVTDHNRIFRLEID